MRIILLFAACLLSLVMWEIAFACIHDRLQVTKADFTECGVVRDGPITRPDHYNAHPFRSKGGTA